MLGLHTTVAPRRTNSQAPPVLEEYTFVPYTQTNLKTNDAALSTYLQKCEKAAQNIVSSGTFTSLKDCEEMFSNGIAPIPETSPVSEEKCILLKLLEQIGQLETEQDAKEIIEANKDLQDDCLLSALINSSSFKACVDVVRENLSGTKIKITEVAAEKGRLFKQIAPQLLQEPQIQLDYIAATSSTASDLDASLLQELGVTEATWNWNTKPGQNIANSNLVIANNVLHAQPNLSAAIAQLKTVLAPDTGYLLIKEATSHLAVPWLVARLTQAAPITDAQHRTTGAFCDVHTWRGILAANGLEVIAEKSDGLLSTMFLCRVMRDSPEPRVIRCHSLDYAWLQPLKDAVADPQVQRLWLVAPTLNTGLVGMVNCLRQEPGGQKIRYTAPLNILTV
jgi:fatty acid synthase